MTYSQKLLDPRWQRRKSEVQRKANFTCEDCGSTTKTIHVHHSFYIRGKEPWEYDDDLLMLLCDDCHVKRQGLEEVLQVSFAKRLRKILIVELEEMAWAEIGNSARFDHLVSSRDMP